MLALLDIESKARGFVLRIADDARRRSSSTRGKGFAGSREFFDRDRLRHRGLQHRQQLSDPPILSAISALSRNLIEPASFVFGIARAERGNSMG
jgi:hypothetical protein